MEDKRKRTIQELHIDSRALYDYLEKGHLEGTQTTDAIIPYSELSGLIGRDIQKEARGNLYTAIRMMQNEYGVVYGTVNGVGIKRLTDEEVAYTGDVVVQHVRKATNRGIKKLVCVKDFDALPNDAKVKHNASLSILGVFKEMTKQKKIKQIEAKVNETQLQLPIMKTIEAFIGRSV